MTKIKWYNFNSQQWSNWFSVQVGYEENWRNDKTFDDATIKIKTTIKPIINIGDFVIFSEFENLTYTDEMLPQNHSQYIVYNISINKNRAKNIWYTELILIEPTQYLKGMQSQTLSFTNQIEKEVIIDDNTLIYTQDRYNVLSAIERILKVGKTNTDKFDGVRIDGISHYNRIKLLDKNELSKINFNDKTFNSADLYTIFFDIGEIINKTPVLYFDLLNINDYKAEKVEIIPNYNLQTITPSNLSEDYYIDNGEFKSKGGVLDHENIFTARGQVWYKIENNELFKIKVIDYSVNGANVNIYGYAEKFILRKLTNVELANDEKPTFLLKFERQDGFDKDIINFDDIYKGNIGYQDEQTFDNYATNISTNLFNINTDLGVQIPVQNVYISPQQDLQGRRETIKGSDEKGKWFLETPFKIKRIISIEKATFKGRYDYSEIFSQYRIYELKIDTEILENKYILERKQFEASQLIEDATERDKVCWFEEGSNRIYVNGYFTQPDNNTAINEVYVYNVTYEPLIDGVLSASNDNKYELQINQVNSQVNSIDYTIFLNTYLNSMNKSDIMILHKHNDKDNIFEIGARVKKDNDYYLITNVSIKNAGNKLIVSYQLNKNYQRRNINIVASEEVLKNRAIDYNDLKERFRELIDEIKISAKTIDFNESKILTDKRLLLSALIPNEVNNNKSPQLAIIESENLVKVNGIKKIERDKYLYDIAKVITNNSINISLQSMNNAILGIRKIPKKLANITEQFVGIDKQIPMIYTNPFGENDKLIISFTYLDHEPLEHINVEFVTPDDIAEYNKAKDAFMKALNIFKVMSNLPEIEHYEEELRQNEIFRTEKINEFKGMLENYNQTISFRLISNEDTLIHNKIYELSRLNKSVDTHGLKIKGYSTNKSYLDNQTDNLMFNVSATSELFGAEQSGIILLQFESQTNVENLKSIVITTNYDDRLLTFNNIQDKIIEIKNGQFAIYY